MTRPAICVAVGRMRASELRTVSAYRRDRLCRRWTMRNPCWHRSERCHLPRSAACRAAPTARRARRPHALRGGRRGLPDSGHEFAAAERRLHPMAPRRAPPPRPRPTSSTTSRTPTTPGERGRTSTGQNRRQPRPAPPGMRGIAGFLADRAALRDDRGRRGSAELLAVDPGQPRGTRSFAEIRVVAGPQRVPRRRVRDPASGDGNVAGDPRQLSLISRHSRTSVQSIAPANLSRLPRIE